MPLKIMYGSSFPSLLFLVIKILSATMHGVTCRNWNKNNWKKLASKPLNKWMQYDAGFHFIFISLRVILSHTPFIRVSRFSCTGIKDRNLKWEQEKKKRNQLGEVMYETSTLNLLISTTIDKIIGLSYLWFRKCVLKKKWGGGG